MVTKGALPQSFVLYDQQSKSRRINEHAMYFCCIGLYDKLYVVVFLPLTFDKAVCTTVCSDGLLVNMKVDMQK
jgi:hypothetical protein